MFLARPGTPGPLVTLQDSLRALHEQWRESVQKRMKKRAESGAGPEPEVQWAEVVADGLALVKAAESGDPVAVRARAQAAHDKVAGALVDPGPYEPREECEGLGLRFRVIDDGQRRGIDAQIALAERNTRQHEHGSLEWVEADERTALAVTSGIRAMVAEIHYREIDEAGQVRDVVATEIGADLIGALRFAGVFLDVYRCARAFQDLSPKKAWRFGSSPPSISSDSTATDAAPEGSARSAATAEPPSQTAADGTSPTPSTTPTDARSGTFSTTQTSSKPSTSSASSVTGSASMEGSA